MHVGIGHREAPYHIRDCGRLGAIGLQEFQPRRNHSGNDAFRLCRDVLAALTVFAALAFRMTGMFVGRVAFPPYVRRD